MTIKELYEKYGDVELTEEQVKHIKECLNIKDKKWKPELGQKYYYTDSFGDVEQSIFGNDSSDEYKILTNNMFKTKEEAKLHLEKLNVYYELKNFADENNEEMDWNDTNQSKCNLSYNYKCKEIEIGCVFWCKYVGEIYFTSKEIAKQAIAKVGADKIKKYLFGVE